VDDRVIDLREVSVGYEGERAATLRGVTVSVERGRLVAVTGPNGAGKTTLLEVVNGLLPVIAGTVRVFGDRMTTRSHRLRRRIAYLPQELFFPPETPFLAVDVVRTARAAAIRPFHPMRAEDRLAVAAALAAVGMERAARRPIGRLSGGQQRRILLARAWAQKAELLLLDEPTSNLDPSAKDEVVRCILGVRRELGATALVVTHDAGPLTEASDRTLRLDAGRIVGDRARGAVPVGGAAGR